MGQAHPLYIEDVRFYDLRNFKQVKFSEFLSKEGIELLKYYTALEICHDSPGFKGCFNEYVEGEDNLIDQISGIYLKNADKEDYPDVNGAFTKKATYDSLSRYMMRYTSYSFQSLLDSVEVNIPETILDEYLNPVYFDKGGYFY